MNWRHSIWREGDNSRARGGWGGIERQQEGEDENKFS